MFYDKERVEIFLLLIDWLCQSDFLQQTTDVQSCFLLNRSKFNI